MTLLSLAVVAIAVYLLVDLLYVRKKQQRKFKEYIDKKFKDLIAEDAVKVYTVEKSLTMFRQYVKEELLEPIVKYTCNHEYAPKRATEHASGIDFYCPKEITIPGKTDVTIPLGVKLLIPAGWDMTMNNKSGVSTKLKLIVGAELIDSDYRGIIHAHFFNNSDIPVTLKEGQVIIQGVIRRVWTGGMVKTEAIAVDTKRGEDGFGSTHMHQLVEQPTQQSQS